MEPTLTVSNLDDDSVYNNYFSVAANTSIGAGPYSIHVTAKTKNYGKIITFMSIGSLNYVCYYSYGGGYVLTARWLLALGANGHCGIMCSLLLLSFKTKTMHFQVVINNMHSYYVHYLAQT